MTRNLKSYHAAPVVAGILAVLLFFEYALYLFPDKIKLAELLGMDRKDKEEQPEPRREHRSDRNDRRARRHDEDEEDEDDSPTRRIDFSNLKFGKDYEIK